jgi:vacuolar-type H+-ATPase subunit I/STV1
MRQAYKIAILLTGLLLLVVATGYGQSLGDVAREQRQKQQAKDKVKKDAPPAHKVITDEDIPEHPDWSESTSSKDSVASNNDDHQEDSSVPASSVVTQSGEQWKAAIQAQKNAIAAMQGQIDKLNASIHFVEANRYTNGVQYNQSQLEKQKQVQQMQRQLDEQKKKLEDMQEGARKGGFGSSVYDP